MRCAVGAPGAASPPVMDGLTRTFGLSGGPPRGPPPLEFPGASGGVTPLRRPDLPHGGDSSSGAAAGPPAAEEPHTLSHGSGWSISTTSQLPNPERFVRDNCIWDLDKNTYSRMKMRWLNTLQREWHPDVALVFQGKLNFDPGDPTRFYRAVKLLDQFVWHHLNLTGSITASHLANSIEHARKTGVIVASNGKSLIEYLDNWIKITDADEARRAREALLGLQVQPQFTLVELE